MKLPPLRTGTCLIGKHRYPAIVGKVQGRTREMFVCGLHVERFLGGLPPEALRQLQAHGVSFRVDGNPL